MTSGSGDHSNSEQQRDGRLVNGRTVCEICGAVVKCLSMSSVYSPLSFVSTNTLLVHYDSNFTCFITDEVITVMDL